MASGDTIETIEVVEPSLTINMNNAKEPGGLHDSLDESEDKESTAHKTPQDAGQKLSTNVVKTKAEREKERERKIGHRRVGVGGEITYKKIQTSQIMGSIQLGIQHAVGGLASKPERDLLMQDFMTVETTNFPSEGSNHTPAHHFSEFKFKNYAPIAFRYFRDLFGIQPDDFLVSMCDSPLRELSNPGASGSIFYLTSDDEFIIKTVQHKEGEFLQKLLPGYYMNLNQNPRTLLPKFFGLYCYQCNSKNVRLVIMNNLLPSSIVMHQKYDLKGSTYKRKASKAESLKRSPTYKDLDFMEHHPEGILMEADTYNALVKTIHRDCRVLESFKIMDYSLLLTIHNLDQAAREKLEKRSHTNLEEVPEEGTLSDPSGAMIHNEREREKEDRIGAAALNRSRSINRQRLVAHSTAMESIQAESEPIDEDEDVPPGGIPARNAKGERLLLFVGIIDILQSYRLKKKLEHTWKSMIHDGDTVSVHRPSFYAQRFQKFMAEKVFKKIPSPLKHSPSKRKSLSRPTRPHEELDSNSVAPSCCSTPPPTFDEVLEQRASVPLEGVPSSTPARVRVGSHHSHHHVTTVKNYRDDVVSITDIKLESRAETKSSLSVESGSSGAGHSSHSRGLAWTPPASVEGSTPTWTEGTPSFTESSSSGDMVRCSEKFPNDCVPDLKYIRGVFGIELTTLLTAHNAKLPFVVTKCVAEVEARGLTTEGIYRLSGFAEEIEAIKMAFDKADGDKADLSQERYPNINVITGALKSYLRLLPIPLITFFVHPLLIDAMQHKSHNLKISTIKNALSFLPKKHYDTLKYMIEHLHRVSLHSAINKMNPHNLGTVFAPTLIGPTENANDVLPDMTTDILSIETMITHCESIFDT